MITFDGEFQWYNYRTQTYGPLIYTDGELLDYLPLRGSDPIKSFNEASWNKTLVLLYQTKRASGKSSKQSLQEVLEKVLSFSAMAVSQW